MPARDCHLTDACGANRAAPAVRRTSISPLGAAGRPKAYAPWLKAATPAALTFRKSRRDCDTATSSVLKIVESEAGAADRAVGPCANRTLRVETLCPGSDEALTTFGLEIQIGEVYVPVRQHVQSQHLDSLFSLTWTRFFINPQWCICRQAIGS